MRESRPYDLGGGRSCHERPYRYAAGATSSRCCAAGRPLVARAQDDVSRSLAAADTVYPKLLPNRDP